MIQSVVEKVLQQMNVDPFNPSVIPIAVSARHVHLSQADLEGLFGPSYTLRKKRDLSQPDQFAAEETVAIAGPRGAIENVRILGPLRTQSQVEVSWTDAIKLGLQPPLRQSGNLINSSPVTLIGPKGSLYLKLGLIIAQAHIHMHPSDAERLGVHDRQFVQIKVNTERPISFENVLIRVSPSYRLEMHIDTDEANAGRIQSGQVGFLQKAEGIDPSHTVSHHFAPSKIEEISVYQGKVLSRINVEKSAGAVLRIRKSTIVTELAKETARDLGKTIEIMDI
jgi:putative phosphotransacetylase